MQIIEFVNQLRADTGVGLIHAHRAWRECLGHNDLALRWVKTKGLAVNCIPGKHPHDLVKAEAQNRGPSTA